MPRPPSVWYHEKNRYWISTALGPFNEKTGRRSGERNLDIGPPTGRDGPANEAKARLWLAERLAAQGAAEGAATRGDLTFGELARDYLAWCRGRGLAERTIRGYDERLLAFAGFKSGKVAYGDILIKDFRPADLRRVVKQLREEGSASTWVRDVSGAARAAFAWAVAPIDDRIPERLLREDPFIGVEKVKLEEPPKRYAGAVVRDKFFRYAAHRVSTYPKAERLARRFDRLFVDMCRFIEATGCRPDEACRLEWAHIDWEDRVARLKGKTTGATGKKRRLPLPPEIVALLKSIRSLPERHPVYVFTHEIRVGGNPTLEGIPWTSNGFSHKFGDWRDDLISGLTESEAEGLAALTPYQLRRDLGSDILRATGSHAESAEVLGHSAETNARYYAHLEEGRAVVRADEAASRRRARQSKGG